MGSGSELCYGRRLWRLDTGVDVDIDDAHLYAHMHVGVCVYVHCREGARE